jgi:hypothetical protein
MDAFGRWKSFMQLGWPSSSSSTVHSFSSLRTQARLVKMGTRHTLELDLIFWWLRQVSDQSFDDFSPAQAAQQKAVKHVIKNLWAEPHSASANQSSNL